MKTELSWLPPQVATAPKNGTTSKSTTRWRCTHCGHSFTRNT
ncbi:IS1/IS1595 family N-terminal zinc-binding domain-containing protein, partial [Corynebacterium urealyticum]